MSRIRKLCQDDFEIASEVLWKSFYEAEKHNHSMQGMELFRDLVSPISLAINEFQGDIELFGAFEDGHLSAVGAVKEKCHILMLYVHPDRQGRGIGKALLSYLETKCETETITVHSSDMALSFYARFGYKKNGERTVENELIFTPMKKTVSK